MSINGVKEHNSILNQRRANSTEKQKYEYFYPNKQLDNRTIEEFSKDLFKPKIIKHKRQYNYKSTNDKDNNINYIKETQQNQNRVNSLYISNSIDNLNNINTNNENHNFIPRIVRNKKDINKYINKEKNIRENDNLNNNVFNQPKRSFSKDNINKNSLKKNQFQVNNKRIKRNVSYDNNLNNDNLALCKNCFDRKMLEEESPKNQEIDKIEYLNNKFINENPFYFIDKMSDNEKNRINEKIESNSNKQRLAFANYKREIDNPKNNTKEKLQLINEYSINPLAIEVGKDPRYFKQKK